jgi:hypothetical protein
VQEPCALPRQQVATLNRPARALDCIENIKWRSRKSGNPAPLAMPRIVKDCMNNDCWNRESLIISSGFQEMTDILAGDEMGDDDDVVHFVGWGYFSLTERQFLPIRARPMDEGSLKEFGSGETRIKASGAP